MSSRIERVVREVSDLRNFYLSLQKSRKKKSGGDPAFVAESSTSFGTKEQYGSSTGEDTESLNHGVATRADHSGDE